MFRRVRTTRNRFSTGPAAALRGGGSSLTASAVAALRALASRTPAAAIDPEDEIAVQLLPWPLRVALQPVLGTRTGRHTLAPALAAASLGLADHVALRSTMLDRELRAAVFAGCEQVVIVGAGLDSRAHRMHELAGARVFEVDREAGQRDKRARALDLALFARALRYVSADLARDALSQRLAEAGHDGKQSSVFIVEGVLPYIDARARTRLFAEIARCSARGSRILLTYVPVDLPWMRIAAPVVHAALWAIGEPLLGLLSDQELAQELEAEGFVVESDTDTRDWAVQLLGAGAGERVRAVFERLVVARR